MKIYPLDVKAYEALLLCICGGKIFMLKSEKKVFSLSLLLWICSNMLPCFVLFCFVLFCFVLFCFVLFCLTIEGTMHSIGSHFLSAPLTSVC